MRILQVLPELNVGGVETGTLDLSKRLVQMGHTAVVVSAGGTLVKDLEAAGAKHYKLPVNKKSFILMFKQVKKLAEIIEKENIDIVHARSRVPAWIAYFTARRTRRVFITTCHGYYSKHPFSFVMGWAKRVIVLSNVIARHMIDDFGVPFDRIRLVPRSVDLDKFTYLNPKQKRKQEFNVGIIGRITPLKGHLYFIKAMARVARVVPELKIWIVGDAPASKDAYKEQIQVLVKRLGLSASTQFLGTQRDIPAILSQLDCLVLATTTQEAFGRVVIEAQASGVPVVATKVGGVIDVIDDNKTGLLVSPADPVSMADAVIKLYKDTQLCSSISEAAYAKVKAQYNLGLMVDNTVKVYEDALRNKKMLIIKFSSLGDIILSTAAFKAIREKFKDNYKISVLVNQEFKDVLFGCPYIDELLISDFKNRDKGILGLLRLGAKLRKHDFDKVIDLQNNRKSHILSFLSLAPDRYGYNKKLGFLLNRRIKDDFPTMDPVRHQFRILNMLDVTYSGPVLELWPKQKDFQYIDEFLGAEWLSTKQKLVGINISASLRWMTKVWPLESVAKLCEELSRREIRVVITGTEQDIETANKLIGILKNTKIINACGKTNINQLACLIKKCEVFISGDSAPLHVAASQGVAMVALFGPTDPRRHVPPSDKIKVVRKELSCAPCYKSKCKTVKCMNLITVDDVLAAVDNFLGNKAQPVVKQP